MLSHIYEEREVYIQTQFYELCVVLCNVLMVMLQLTTTPENVAVENPVRNSPRFVAFIGETQSQYCLS